MRYRRPDRRVPRALASSTSHSSHLTGDRQGYCYSPFLDRKSSSLALQVFPGSQSCHYLPLPPASAHTLLLQLQQPLENADRTRPDHASNLSLLSALFTPSPKPPQDWPCFPTQPQQPPLRNTPHSFPPVSLLLCPTQLPRPTSQQDPLTRLAGTWHK